MVVHLPFFLLGLALLWLPRRWMRLGSVFARRKRRHRAEEPWKNREPNHARVGWLEFKKSRNYFDLLRGAAGALAIVGGTDVAASLQAPAEWQNGELKILAIQVVILLVGLLIQTMRNERGSVKFYPPVFYVAGISFALCGPWAAFFAFALIWAANPLLGTAQAFLVIYAGLMAGFGYLLGGDLKRCLVAGGLCLLPTLLSLLSGRPLLVLSRKAMSSDAAS